MARLRIGLCLLGVGCRRAGLDCETRSSTTTTTTTGTARRDRHRHDVACRSPAGSFHDAFRVRALVTTVAGQPVTTGSIRFSGEFVGTINYPPADQLTVPLDSSGEASVPCVRLAISAGLHLRAEYLGTATLAPSSGDTTVFVRPTEPTVSTTWPCG